MENSIPFYLIDENESDKTTLKKIINKIFPQSQVYIENDGMDAWDFIKKNPQPMILLCEDNVSGVNAINLHKKIRTLDNPDQYFFCIISSSSEQELIIKILQSGVDDVIKQPLSVDNIITKIRLAHRIVKQELLIKAQESSINELSLDLGQDSENMKELLTYFLQLRIPDYQKQIKRITDKALWIYSEQKETSNDELKDIEKAAQLCLIWKLSLPDILLNSPVLADGQVFNEKMKEIPEITSQILSNFRDYEKVSNIICHIYENFDGTGIPDRIKGWQIPLGSRILRVIIDYEYYTIIKNLYSHKVIEMLEHEAQRLYDFRIISLLDQYEAVKGTGSGREQPVKIKEITEGMIISRDIVTRSGIKILSRGVTFDPDKINKLSHIAASDPIIGKIYVRVK
jgi:response regulator RpfG family c-di-GMP phosphodiesterase